MRIKISSAFCVFLCLSHLSFAEEPAPNPGPRSSSEAIFLFDEGTHALEQKKYPTAVRSLGRFIDRYPSNEKVKEAYLGLIDALNNEKKFNEALRRGKEFLNLKVDQAQANRARTLMAESNLDLQQYLEARLISDELLKNEPTTRQKATAFSIKFQSFLEEKLFTEAHEQLDALRTLLDKEPIEPFTKMIPEFKMTIAMRECLLSHLIKDKVLTEEEVTDYFKEKNLCFKSALPSTLTGVGAPTIHEWCESFTFLNHELQRIKIDPFLKTKIDQDLKATFEFTKPLSIELSKCYEPIKPLKNKKRHRKRRLHSP